jgi:hypothetical protein
MEHFMKTCLSAMEKEQSKNGSSTSLSNSSEPKTNEESTKSYYKMVDVVIAEPVSPVTEQNDSDSIESHDKPSEVNHSNQQKEIQSVPVVYATEINNSSGEQKCVEVNDIKMENSFTEPMLMHQQDIATIVFTPEISMQLVRHVTFPDGSVIQPGVVFRKTWLLRNSGNCAWPALYLVNAGGDNLSGTDVRIPVKSIQAGEEVEVSVHLASPDESGRFVAFFRLQQADNSSLGARLLADITVVENDSEWQYISKSVFSSGKVSDASMLSEVNSEINNDGDNNYAVDVDQMQMDLQDDLIANQSLFVNEQIQLDANANSQQLPQDQQQEQEQIPILSDFEREQCIAWNSELTYLRDLGFSDLDALLPLLREHVKIPGNRQDQAMERVVTELLNSL